MTIVINMVDLPVSGTVRYFEGIQFGDAHVSFFLVDLPPGDGPDLHTHPYEEIFVVQEGQVTVTSGDATIEASGGQIVIVPAGSPHRFVNSGTGPLRQINIHASPRMITAWLPD